MRLGDNRLFDHCCWLCGFLGLLYGMRWLWPDITCDWATIVKKDKVCVCRELSFFWATQNFLCYFDVAWCITLWFVAGWCCYSTERSLTNILYHLSPTFIFIDMGCFSYDCIRVTSSWWLCSGSTTFRLSLTYLISKESIQVVQLLVNLCRITSFHRVLSCFWRRLWLLRSWILFYSLDTRLGLLSAHFGRFRYLKLLQIA
jgi:hypothetical protein